MNTSHNKNIVLDDGWWGTLRNTLGLSSNSTSDESCMGIQNTRGINSNKVRSFVDTTIPNKETSVKPDVYSLNPVINQHENLLIDEVEVPTTSKVETQFGQIANQTGVIPKQQIKSSESEDEVEYSPHKSSRLLIGEEILSNMIKNIHNESAYLHYLKELSQFEEYCHNAKGPSNDFKIVHLNDIPSQKMNQIKTTKQLAIDKPCENDGKHGFSEVSKNTSFIDDDSETGFIGHLQARIDMRGQLFIGVEECCSDEESYERLVNTVLDFEESLIED